jgi:Cu(I)/Ag(I) efflux system membrane fusion protein
MKLKHMIIGFFVFVALGAMGFGLYQLGRYQGLSTTPPISHTDSTQKISTVEVVDPTSWGIPEGEAATRRHIKDGLKAGEVDPLTGRKILYYQDPMMPGKNFDTPGKSPFMDMMLVPVYAGSEGADQSDVVVSPRAQQNLGLRIAEAIEGTLTPNVVAVGTIAWNERDQSIIQARAVGYVEKMWVRATLDHVNKGQPLLDLYVPEWVAVQEDFLLALRMKKSDQNADTIALLDGARTRMRQAGMDNEQIRLVESTEQVQARLVINSPINGVIAELATREGMTVMPGTTLVRINGLSKVWANAEVPESQIALLRPGTKVIAKTPAFPGKNFNGRVQAVLPEVDPQTRTIKARMELANSGERLVPGMLVQMEFSGTPTHKSILIPTEAVIQTGKRTLVMVAEEKGKFRPVEIEPGIEENGQTEVIRGLQAGQKVVVSGQFLIDSEASLKGIETRLNQDSGKEDKKEMAQMKMTQMNMGRTYKTIAHIEAINDDLVTLSHPAIPSLKWPPMTMDFKLSPEIQTHNLVPSQAVHIEFQIPKGEPPRIVSIRPIEPNDSMKGGISK